MGLRETLSGLIGKRQTTPDKIIAAGVRPTDEAAGRYGRNTRGRDMQRVDHYVSWVGICAALNASQVAAVPLRLYRRKEERSKRVAADWRGRAVPRAQKDFMRSRLVSKSIADFAQTADDIEEITDGPLVDLLNQPNPWNNGTQFWEFTQLMLELTGKAFQHIVVGDEPQLWPMMTQYVTIMPSREDLIGSFIYGRGTETERLFPVDEVAYYRHRLHPYIPWEGIGPLDMVIRDSDIDFQRDEYNRGAWANGLSIAALAMFEQGVSRDDMQRTIDDINNHHMGASNAGKILGLRGGTAVERLGLTPRDMMAESGDDPTASKIWAAFGVPESLLRLNDANLASSTTGHTQYQCMTLTPRVCLLADMMTQRIIPAFMDVNPGDIICAPDNPVTEDDTSRRTVMQGEVAAGVLTTNEYRQEFGYPPIPGGDTVRAPVPQFGAPSPGGSVTPPGPVRLGPGEVVTLSFDPEPDPANEPTPDPEPVVKADAPEPEPERVALPAPCCPTHTRTSDLWTKAADISNDPEDPREQEQEAFAALSDAFGQIMRETLARMRAAPYGTDKGNHRQFAGLTTKDDRLERVIADWVLPNSVMRDIIDGRLSPVVTVQLQASARESLAEISREASVEVPDPGEGFNLSRDPAVEALRAYDEERAKRLDEIAQGWADRLTRTLAEGLEAGETFDGLTERVAAEFTGDVDASGLSVGDRRAALIARTETAFAQGQGRMIGDMESGVVTGKRWRPAGAVCEFCAAADREFGDGGRVVPLGEAFYTLGTTVRGLQGGTMLVDFVPIQHPPLHPNCRCTYTRVIG